MSKQPTPKPYCGGQWSHARFFGFLRSGLRRMSVQWNPKSQALRNARRPYKGENKRRSWEYRCAECGNWKAGKDVAVHHIVPCGTLKCYADLPGFVERLFCEVDGFEVLCGSCHAAKTEKEKV